MDNNEFIARVIITVMDDDPAKIIEASDDAQSMESVAFGCTRAELMAEYALSMFKSQNMATFPEMIKLTEADETIVENMIAAHIVKAGW